MSKSNTKLYQNKRAFFDYNISDRLECGIELKGDEIKAVRQGKVQLKGSWAKILQGKTGRPELFILGLYIGSEVLDPQRARRLLIHKKQIRRLIGQTQQKSLTLIPTKLYFRRGRAKLELGIAKAKKRWDKRQTIKDRELKRGLKRY
jgi:SsrA-binding protein